MTTTEALTIIALLVGPLVAVQVTRYLDDRREIRQRKLWIFKTLMATRISTLAPHHVEALNRIDLEFNPKRPKEKEVINAWKAYLDHLNQNQASFSLEQMRSWVERRIDLLCDLLHTMANVLDYDFDKTHIKNACYYPRGYGEHEADWMAIRVAARELTEGKRSIPISLVNIPPPKE